MTKLIEFDGPPPSIAITQTSTLRFVLSGFTMPSEVRASGFQQSPLRFDIENGSLQFNSATGKFSFRAAVNFRSVAPHWHCIDDDESGEMVVLRSVGSRSEHPAIILTERFKIEFIGLRSVPAPTLHHQGYCLTMGGLLKFPGHPGEIQSSDGDFSITIIDDDGSETSKDFPASIHYTIPPTH